MFKYLFGIFVLFSLSFSQVNANASLLFEPNIIESAQNSEFVFDILIDTYNNKTGGVGIKLNFDPQKINIISISNSSIFSDYPTSSFDNQTGEIKISGISASPEDLFQGKAVFTTIRALAKSPGNTKFEFEFVPGSTTDSNIAITTEPWDVLETVNTLSVNILSPQIPSPGQKSENPSSSSKYLIAGIISFCLLLIIIILIIKKRHKANSIYL